MVSPVAAQAQGSSTDPGAGSPAGTMYELPLDDARGDAAPRRPAPPSSPTARRSGSGESTGPASLRPSSAIRSENGFGSSAIVPGTGAAVARAGGRAIGGGATARATFSASSGAADGAGDAGSPGAARSDEQRAPVAVAQPAGARAPGDSKPSSLLTYGLLALVIAAGLAGGLVTRTRRRHPG